MVLVVLVAAFAADPGAAAQQLPSPIGAAVAHRYLVAYRDISIANPAQPMVHLPGVQVVRQHTAFGIAVVQTDANTEDAAVAAL